MYRKSEGIIPSATTCLERNDTHTSALVHNCAHTTSSICSVRVRNRHATDLRNADITVGKDVVLVNSVAILIGVKVRDNSTLGVGEGVLLDQNLGAHAGVYARGRVVNVAAAVDVTGAKTDGWKTRVHVLEEVVVVRDVELASVLAGIRVGVADKRALPLCFC